MGANKGLLPLLVSAQGIPKRNWAFICHTGVAPLGKLRVDREKEKRRSG